MMDKYEISIEKLRIYYLNKHYDLIDNETLISFYFNENKFAKNTYLTIKNALHKLTCYFSNKNLQLINSIDARKFLDEIESNSYSLNYKKLIYQKIKVFYNYFLRDDYGIRLKIRELYKKDLIINKNPFLLRYKFTGKRKRSDEILEKDEIPKFLKIIRRIFNFRKYLMIKLMLNSSSRVDGICNLKKESIDWDLRKFSTFDKGKERVYGFDNNLKNELLIYLKMRSNFNCKNEYFFVNENFEKYSSEGVIVDYNAKKYIVKKELGKEILLTNLRYTFETLRLVDNQNSDIVKALMSRKEKNLIQVYLKLKGKKFTEAFDKFNFM